MVNKPKIKGTAAEGLVVRVLRWLFPYAERRALAGVNDKGDVSGTPFVWEVKAVRNLSLPGALRETEVERVNAGAAYGFLVIKLNGYGEAKAHLIPAVLPLVDLLRLLSEAGYGDLESFRAMMKLQPPRDGG
jgi:hypothetical protein